MSRLGLMNGVGPKSFNPTGTVTPEIQTVVQQRLEDKLSQKLGWKHGFYAISSNSQMDLIDHLDAGTNTYYLDLDEGSDFKIRER